MKTKLFPLMAVVVLLVSGGWAGYGGQKEMRWEYTVFRTLNDPGSIQGRLNSFGATGWEVVSVTEIPFENSSQSFVTIYLKRAK